MINEKSFINGAKILVKNIRDVNDELACFYCANMLELFIPLVPMLSDSLKAEVVFFSKELLSCQEKHDWASMCDYLEFELPHLISQLKVELNGS
ncbi:MAG: hypothetical protein ACRCZA_09250 [Shewanella sp.]|uniref:hypothetical protein n=1 Tax=Shewanella sp. TaxID=50422 RepID=UPI003F2E0B1C